MDAALRPLTFRSASARFSYPVLRLIYLWRFGRWPDLSEPRLFSELVQARKLYDRDPRWPVLADKVRVKKHVADVLGDEWVIPTLWHGTKLPEAPPWPRPFVLKSSHGSHQCFFVRERDDACWAKAQVRARRWLKRPYGQILDEWLYGEIEPQLLVEPFVGSGNALPLDYKFFVFGGRAEFVQVDTDRERAHKRVIFDREWRRLPAELEFPADPREIPPPLSLHRMIEAAEALGAAFDFVRVDFYDVGRPLFGEMTFYPGSGLERFRPAAFDRLFGERWIAARAGARK